MKLFIYNDDTIGQWIVVLDDKPAMTAGYHPEEIRKLGAFVAEKIMTQSKQCLDDLQYKDTKEYISSLGKKDQKDKHEQPLTCEHGNKVPTLCECSALCSCRATTCKWRKM